MHTTAKTQNGNAISEDGLAELNDILRESHQLSALGELDDNDADADEEEEEEVESEEEEEESSEEGAAGGGSEEPDADVDELAAALSSVKV
jgi:Ran GTPase-activating protein (RanGAP) involved in mRNA processing and transport